MPEDQHDYSAPEDYWYASWIGGDGKRYGTSDPDVVRRRVCAGHTNWIVRPPAELLEPDTD
jgi:hypothetical protein